MVQYGACVLWTYIRELYLASQAQDLPVPEELTFHIIDQVSKACLFLHERCKLVRVDTNRQNLMLRYPGRKTACMPDVVLFDWSLWDNANAENIARDTEKMYECLFPVFFEAGWRCKEAGHHRDEYSTINSTSHSLKWLELCKTVGTKQKPLENLRDNLSEVANRSRQMVKADSQRAEVIQALFRSTEASFTKATLRDALCAL
jgi:hypothetical protein